MRELASKFSVLFEGAERGYGLYEVTGAKTPEGKRVGNAATKDGVVTLEMWEDHLAGKIRLGVIPIKADSTVRFGAIDVDVYDGLDHKKMAQTLQKYSLPLVLTRSKSGGAHMWCFAREPVSAAVMQRKLMDVAAFLGHGGCEIFPKQVKILAERGDKGNWINMPYQGGTRGMCYGVRIDGEAMSSEDFLAYAEGIRISEEDLEKLVVGKPSEDYVDGPPCLQHLAAVGIPAGTRNNGLFAIAVYLRKAFPEAWEEMLEDYNAKYLDPPLKSSEVQGTIKSAKKKTTLTPAQSLQLRSTAIRLFAGLGNSGLAAELAGSRI